MWEALLCFASSTPGAKFPSHHHVLSAISGLSGLPKRTSGDRDSPGCQQPPRQQDVGGSRLLLLGGTTGLLVSRLTCAGEEQALAPPARPFPPSLESWPFRPGRGHKHSRAGPPPAPPRPLLRPGPPPPPPRAPGALASVMRLQPLASNTPPPSRLAHRGFSHGTAALPQQPPCQLSWTDGQRGRPHPPQAGTQTACLTACRPHRLGSGSCLRPE